MQTDHRYQRRWNTPYGTLQEICFETLFCVEVSSGNYCRSKLIENLHQRRGTYITPSVSF